MEAQRLLETEPLSNAVAAEAYVVRETALRKFSFGRRQAFAKCLFLIGILGSPTNNWKHGVRERKRPPDASRA